MRRMMIAVLAGAVLSAGATWAFAAHSGEFFPTDCVDTDLGTDIDFGTTARYDADGLLTVDLQLGGPSCLAADYSVVVFDEDPNGGIPVVLDAISLPGDGSSDAFTIRRSIDDVDGDGLLDPQRICVNLTVSTTEHESTTQSDTSTSPSGSGNAPPMEDTDSNSIDTETVVDWGSESDTEALPCITIGKGGTGGSGYN